MKLSEKLADISHELAGAGELAFAGAVGHAATEAEALEAASPDDLIKKAEDALKCAEGIRSEPAAAGFVVAWAVFTVGAAALTALRKQIGEQDG